ncbi:hypothetical protein SPB21_02190 [Leptothoe sp. ISB3NOV94-8A]
MSQATLHPSEYQNHYVSGLRAKGVAIATLILASSLTLGSLRTSNHAVRLGLLLSAMASIGASRLAVTTQVEKERIVLDFSDISDASRQQRLYEAMQPIVETLPVADETPETPYRPELFNWVDLSLKANQYPHLMILGNTGDGKTTLAEWLHQMMDGQRIALHPHWQAAGPGERSDFDYCDQIIGGGRRFDAIGEYISGLVEEMDRRAKLGKAELRACPLLSVLVDELPAIAKNCGDATIEHLISLIFEARKFRIRLIVLAQADSVKVLKLEGQGSVRENLTYIRLGSYAKDHAKSLVTKKLIDQRLTDWLSDYDRPAMVEDVPAVVPLISHGQHYGPGVSNGHDGGNSPGNGLIVVNSELTTGVTAQAGPGQVIQFPTLEGYPSASMVQSAALRAIFQAHQQGNLTSKFIKQDLGMQGKYYAGAKRLIDQLLLANH